MKTVHLVRINPADFDKSVELLKWDKPRAVPLPASGGESAQGFARVLLRSGMVCELDDADLEMAHLFGEVEIVGTKEVE